MRKYAITLFMLLVLFASNAGMAFAAAYAGVDTFDTYSAGALAGNNGGSGWGAAWSNEFATASVVENSVVYKGAEAAGNTTANHIESRQTTAVIDSGDIYFAARIGTGGTGFNYLGVGTPAVSDGIKMGFRNGNVSLNGVSAGEQVLAVASIDTWYIFDIQIQSGSTGRGRWKVAGGTWSAFTSSFTSNTTNPQNLRWESNGSLALSYIDEVGTTDPTPASFAFWQLFPF